MSPKLRVGTAWQRQMRDRRADEEQYDIFGNWWDEVDNDIGKATVEAIDYRTAASIINRYEWMESMPAISMLFYGIYFPSPQGKTIGGAVVYGTEYIENLGKWDRYGYTGKIILLARGACAHWAHEHAGSKLIRGSMKLLPERYEVITATVDAEAGEIGTLYQACGFDYIGPMGGEVKGNKVAVLHGRKIPNRTLLDYQRKGIDLSDATFSFAERKGRYFAFRGDKRTQKKNRAAIAHLIKPYPKREQS